MLLSSPLLAAPTTDKVSSAVLEYTVYLAFHAPYRNNKCIALFQIGPRKLIALVLQCCVPSSDMRALIGSPGAV